MRFTHLGWLKESKYQNACYEFLLTRVSELNTRAVVVCLLWFRVYNHFGTPTKFAEQVSIITSGRVSKYCERVPWLALESWLSEGYI